MVTYGKYIAKRQKLLVDLLCKNNVGTETIEDIIASGYSLISADANFSGFESYIYDGFYGSKLDAGIFPVEFITAKNHRWNITGIPCYKIKSLNEAVQILTSERHNRYYSSGKMCFRGQTKEYKTKRRFPNPTMSDNNGEEILILPSLWREYKDDWLARPMNVNNIIHEVLSRSIIEYGLDTEKILTNNIIKNNLFTMGSLAHSKDKDESEFYERWYNVNVLGSLTRDLPLVAQHYGFRTTGLDVTFDLATSLFFASHKFVQDNRGAFYDRNTSLGTGIVYCMVFEEPSLSQSEDLISEVEMLDHIKPLRPLRQACGLPFFHPEDINQAVTELDAIIYLDEEFDCVDLPDQNYLFPSEDEDDFYKFLLQMKLKYPKELHDIVKYSRHGSGTQSTQ